MDIEWEALSRSYPTANQKTKQEWCKRAPNMLCFHIFYWQDFGYWFLWNGGGRKRSGSGDHYLFRYCHQKACLITLGWAQEKGMHRNTTYKNHGKNIKLRYTSTDQSSGHLVDWALDWMLLLFKREEKQIIFAAGYSNLKAFETSKLKQSQRSLKWAVI